MFVAEDFIIAVTTFLVAIIAIVSCRENNFSHVPQRICGEDCRSWLRCNPYADDHIMYAMDEWKCRVFKTPCYLNLENCKRAYHCNKSLSQISKESCILLDDVCENIIKDAFPVCAWFITLDKHVNNEFKTFENVCQLNRYAWKNEKPYISYEVGKCPDEEQKVKADANDAKTESTHTWTL